MSYLLAGVSGVALANVLLKCLSGRTEPLMVVGCELLMLIVSLPLLLAGQVNEGGLASMHWVGASLAALLTLSLLDTALASMLWFAQGHLTNDPSQAASGGG